MRAEDLDNGVASLTRNDPDSARRVRANLAVWARRSGDPDAVRMVNDVLAGRRNVREVLRSRAFRATAGHNVEVIESGLALLTPEVRDGLFEPARQGVEAPTDPIRLAQLRDLGLSGSPVGPDGDAEPTEERFRAPRRP